MKIYLVLLLIASAVIVRDDGAQDKPRKSALKSIRRVLTSPIRLASKLKYAVLGPKLTYEDKEMIRDKAWHMATDAEVAIDVYLTGGGCWLPKF